MLNNRQFVPRASSLLTAWSLKVWPITPLRMWSDGSVSQTAHPTAEKQLLRACLLSESSVWVSKLCLLWHLYLKTCRLSISSPALSLSCSLRITWRVNGSNDAPVCFPLICVSEPQSRIQMLLHRPDTCNKRIVECPRLCARHTAATRWTGEWTDECLWCVQLLTVALSEALMPAV